MIVERPDEVKSVLIRANNWIGDVVMISPAVRAIRAHFRRARVAILAKGWVVEALRGNPAYDELIEFDENGAHRGLAGRLRLAAALRRRRFDLAILFQKAFEAAALAFLAGARIRVGYSTDARSALLTHPLPPPPRGTHHAEAFLDIARALGCGIGDPRPFFHVQEEAAARADALLGGAGMEPGERLVAIHPGASKAPRAWHTERFADLARRLARGPRVRPLAIGGPEDRPALEAIAAATAGRAILPPAGLPLGVSAALIERSSLFVGNDSGPMHLAAALGVPTIGLFGPGAPGGTAPRPGRAPVVAIGRDYPCAPCRQEFFRECAPSPSGKPFCLEEITVDEVERAARGLLSAQPDGP